MNMALILQIILAILAAGGTLVGALAFKSIWWRVIWIVGWGGITLACLILTVITYEPAATSSGTAKALKGGDAYCFFYADINAPRDSEGGFPRIVVNKGTAGISLGLPR
jgi:hypothetical protein